MNLLVAQQLRESSDSCLKAFNDPSTELRGVGGYELFRDLLVALGSERTQIRIPLRSFQGGRRVH